MSQETMQVMVSPGVASTCRMTLARLWTCTCKYSASNCITGAKDHISMQMNMAEADKVTSRFNDQFKTYAIYGAICRMVESDDSILRLAKANNIISKSFCLERITDVEYLS